jgi:hypothetical protein
MEEQRPEAESSIQIAPKHKLIEIFGPCNCVSQAPKTFGERNIACEIAATFYDGVFDGICGRIAEESPLIQAIKRLVDHRAGVRGAVQCFHPNYRL